MGMIQKLAAASAIFAALAASPASALLPPSAYAEARANAPNVVLIAVTQVDFTGETSCHVHGAIVAVERGAKYEQGAPISIEVPCRGHAAQSGPPMVGPVIYQSSQALQESTRGRAYLDENGALARYQYEIVAPE